MASARSEVEVEFGNTACKSKKSASYYHYIISLLTARVKHFADQLITQRQTSQADRRHNTPKTPPGILRVEFWRNNKRSTMNPISWPSAHNQMPRHPMCSDFVTNPQFYLSTSLPAIQPSSLPTIQSPHLTPKPTPNTAVSSRPR